MIRSWSVGWVCLALCSLAGTGCAKKAPPAWAMPEAYREEPMAPPPMQETADADTTRSATTPEARMVHYDGWLRSRVADPRLAIEQVVALAGELGGRTDLVRGNTVTVRVPVDRFDEAWDKALAVGEVMDHTVRADDVTEAFTATELRATTLRETQQRLIELLGKAKEEQEKLTLLQQITQVTEELDRLESQLRMLGDLAAMSRIHAEFVAREAFVAGGGRPTVDGFAWITSLSPFNRAAFDDKRIALPEPEGLVSLTPRGPFMAESADGAVLWTTRVPNDPVGDATFWRSALQERLAAEFTDVAPMDLGAWRCLAMSEPLAEAPYRWEVCLRTVGNKLHVAQVFLPGAAQVERYGEAVHTAIETSGGET